MCQNKKNEIKLSGNYKPLLEKQFVNKHAEVILSIALESLAIVLTVGTDRGVYMKYSNDGGLR